MSVTAFAATYGVLIRDPIPDNRVHRVRTEDHPRKRNGAYRFDGVMGAVRNWATMAEWALYRPDKAASLPPPDAKRIAELRRKAEADEAKRHRRAAAAAADMLKRATIIKPRKATKWADGVYTHPYLERKGFGDAECLVLGQDVAVERDDKESMTFKAGCLLIPMRDCVTQQLVGMQAIDKDGTKLFIPGSRAKGAVFCIGRAPEIWLCEGVATAYSVLAGLRVLYREACVMACFSAGNVIEVASRFKEARVFVAADNDASGAGAKAAQATAKPWVMPDEVGTDFNDLMAARGVQAVRDVLRRIL